MQIHHKSSVSGIKVFCSAFSPADFLQREPSSAASLVPKQSWAVKTWPSSCTYTDSVHRQFHVGSKNHLQACFRSFCRSFTEEAYFVFLNLMCVKTWTELIRTKSVKTSFQPVSSACCSMFSGLTVSTALISKANIYNTYMRNISTFPSLIFFKWSENMKKWLEAVDCLLTCGWGHCDLVCWLVEDKSEAQHCKVPWWTASPVAAVS